MNRFNHLFIIAVLMISTFIIAEASQKPSQSTKPDLIKQLEDNLSETNQQSLDRNSRLRIERATYYYAKAIEYHDARWRSKASEMARRGMNLINLQKSKAQSVKAQNSNLVTLVNVNRDR